MVGGAVLLVPRMISSTVSVEGPVDDAAIIENYRQTAMKPVSMLP